MRRRIAVLSTDPGIALGGAKGAAVHLAELSGAFAEVGADVLLLVRDRANEAAAPTGVDVEVLPGPGRRGSVADRLQDEDALARWIEQRLRAFGADALYERLALHSAAGREAAARLGLPYGVEINAPLLEEAAAFRELQEGEAARALERMTLCGADVVFAVSGPVARYAVERGARNVEVLPNAVAAWRCTRPPEAHRPPAAVFCGALRPWHGTEVLAAAWRRMGTSAPELVVLGDGPGRTALEHVGATITGFVPQSEVATRLAGCDIGLAPYTADGPGYFSPLKLFDYLAAGLAVVAARLPGVLDIVDDGTALLVDPGDDAGVADAVKALAVDESRRLALGRAGQALVAERHTWDRRARRILMRLDAVGRGSEGE